MSSIRPESYADHENEGRMSLTWLKFGGLVICVPRQSTEIWREGTVSEETGVNEWDDGPCHPGFSF